MKKLTKQWLDKAFEDLQGAEVLLEQKEPLGNITGFLCQQAVEKSLKGFLEENNKDVPRIHDVVFLAERCNELDGDFEPFIRQVQPFIPFAVDVRYPGNSDFKNEKDTIAGLFETAGNIFNMVKNKIER